MKKCFGYVRVSTVKQGEGVSLEAQRDAILAFAAKNNITITKWFEEKETAAKAGRPTFAAMIRALRRRSVDGVVMHKIDRSARNFADWAKIGELSDAGIDVHFATETLDFRSRGGRLSADIQAVIAADYIRNLREETIKGINGRLSQGLYPFKAPIGYLDNGRGRPKTPDPVRAQYIREMFELYGSGEHSFASLRAEMKRRGLQNDRRMPLTKGGVEKVLRNPFYFGLIRINTTGETYPGIHEPLISASLFDRVQLIRAGKTPKRVVKHDHTFRRLFRCQRCQRMMTAELQKGHVYYRCHAPGCPTNCVREETITAAVVRLLSRVRFSDEAVVQLLQAAEERWQRSKGTDVKKALQVQLFQADARLERLTDAVVDQVIDRQTYLKRKEKLLAEKIRLQEQAEKIDTGEDDVANLKRFFELMKSLKNMYIFALPAEKREIVEITTSNRTVANKNVWLEPANWLRAAECAVTAYGGDPHRPTLRRPSPLQDQQLDALVEATQSEKLKGMLSSIDRVRKPATKESREDAEPSNTRRERS